MEEQVCGDENLSEMKEIGKNQSVRKRIPKRLASYFQDYDPKKLNIEQDANLIIERALEFGAWNELRWLWRVYGSQRIARYVREMGARNLSPDAFNYWRKMLRLKKWRNSPFSLSRGDVWQH